MSDPIEEALSLLVDCAERAAALEALAVLRGRLAEAHLTVAELVEEAKDAEAENVSLKEALRVIADTPSGKIMFARQFARAALASSEGEADA
jgi:hypothetical protein